MLGKRLIAVAFTTVLIAMGTVSIGSAAPLLEIALDGDSFDGDLPLGDRHDVYETNGAAGWYDANLYALENVSLKYEFLGYEADWTNGLIVDGQLAITNKGSVIGDSAESTASADSLLDFAFSVLAGGNAGAQVQNGSNASPSGVPSGICNYGQPNFFLGYADESHNSVYIALDDGGGLPWYEGSLDDDDHDDLVIKVTATAAPVPVPATILLFGTGLFGLVGARRKTRKK